jgi:hypothetical protein
MSASRRFVGVLGASVAEDSFQAHANSERNMKKIRYRERNFINRDRSTLLYPFFHVTKYK